MQQIQAQMDNNAFLQAYCSVSFRSPTAGVINQHSTAALARQFQHLHLSPFPSFSQLSSHELESPWEPRGGTNVRGKVLVWFEMTHFLGLRIRKKSGYRSLNCQKLINGLSYMLHLIQTHPHTVKTLQLIGFSLALHFEN